MAIYAFRMEYPLNTSYCLKIQGLIYEGSRGRISVGLSFVFGDRPLGPRFRRGLCHTRLDFAASSPAFMQQKSGAGDRTIPLIRTARGI
ncbi:hypothetical protein GDO81_009608 [Engystomops pustulosus]|uniref:Uncharacterized protein n=1 Tax=Engystomops pustulosus TaxID=76066 RepID=A0AAV7BSQ1_ENGPU|nr:hypothetical protein GDO81_009608 [Engystomops pustulosus]